MPRYATIALVALRRIAYARAAFSPVSRNRASKKLSLFPTNVPSRPFRSITTATYVGGRGDSSWHSEGATQRPRHKRADSSEEAEQPREDILKDGGIDPLGTEAEVIGALYMLLRKEATQGHVVNVEEIV